MDPYKKRPQGGGALGKLLPILLVVLNLTGSEMSSPYQVDIEISVNIQIERSPDKVLPDKIYPDDPVKGLPLLLEVRTSPLSGASSSPVLRQS